MKKILEKISLLKIVTLILAVILVFSFVSKIPEFTMKSSVAPVVNPKGIDELTGDNEVISKNLNGAVLVSESAGKKLYVMPKTLNVIVEDTATGTIWKSNPTTGSLTEAEKAPLNISFLDATGAVKNWDVFTYCINRDNTTRELEAGESLTDTYQINYIENGFRVTMDISESESTELDQYMPKEISVERYTSCFLDKISSLLAEGKITEDDDAKYKKALSMIYTLDAETEASYYNKYAGTPPVTVTKILIDLSKKVEYTQEDLINDSSEFGITDVEFSKPAFFTIVMDVTLDENGDLVVHIPTYKIENKSGLDDEVLEKLESGEYTEEELAAWEEEANASYMLQKIAVFPNFGLVNATQHNDGFIFVPDGSGALFDINSYDSGYAEYNRPIYKNNYFDTLYTDSEYNEDLQMPVFGMGKKGSEYVVVPEVTEENEKDTAEVTEEATEAPAEVKQDVEIKTEVKGDKMTGFMGIIESGAETASLVVNLGVKDTSNGGTNFNKVYPSFDVMQYSNVKVFGPYSTNDAKFLATTKPFDVDLIVRYKLYTENCNYYEMAKDYKEFILETNPEVEVNYEGAPEVFLDVISALTVEDRFMGVPYDSTISMTTYSQLGEILADLEGVDTVVSYKGAYNGGIYNSVNTDAKKTSKNGSKADFEALMKEHGDSIYMSTPISYVYKDTAAFNASKHGLLGYDSEAAYIYDYDIPTGRFNIHGEAHWILSPFYLPNVVKSFSEDAGNVNLAIEDLGNVVYANYDPETEVNLYEGEKVVNEALTTLSANERSLILYNPFASRMLFADYSADISRESSDYGLIKHNVPFRQLVMNGLTKYTTLDINESSSGKDYYLLQALELGSMPKYKITYSSVDILKENNYTELYSTQYSLIAEDIKAMAGKVDEAFEKIGSREIVGHKILSEKVFETTYASGVKVVVNYNTLDVETPCGPIAAEGYMIVEAAEETVEEGGVVNE